VLFSFLQRESKEEMGLEPKFILGLGPALLQTAVISRL